MKTYQKAISYPLIILSCLGIGYKAISKIPIPEVIKSDMKYTGQMFKEMLSFPFEFLIYNFDEIKKDFELTKGVVDEEIKFIKDSIPIIKEDIKKDLESLSDM